jgi:hypothetical protein
MACKLMDIKCMITERSIVYNSPCSTCLFLWFHNDLEFKIKLADSRQTIANRFTNIFMRPDLEHVGRLSGCVPQIPSTDHFSFKLEAVW